MNWIGYLITLLTVIIVIDCILLIFAVLLQRPKNEGLGAAFGGDTASNIFGAQTTNVLVTLTRWLGGIFIVLCLLISFLQTIDPQRKSKHEAFIAEEKQKKEAFEKTRAAEEAAKAAELELKKKQSPETDPKIETPDAKTIPAPMPDKPSSAPTPVPTPPTPAPAQPEASKNPPSTPPPTPSAEPDKTQPKAESTPTQTPAQPPSDKVKVTE